MTVWDTPHLILVGSGGQPYREYSLATLAQHYRLSAILPTEPTWQRTYLAGWRVADLGDNGATVEALSSLRGADPDTGLLTWDETVLERTAWAAEKLSFRHMSAQSAARCRDKFLTRSLLARARVAVVRYGLAESAVEAVRVADTIGYPVVVKPRAMAGSIGVVLAGDASAVRAAFATASQARYATLPTGHGVLVEEYLDGPEISVDSVVFDGEVTCVQVAHKRLGFAPYFEEVGHLVTDWAGEPWADGVRALVAAAHHTLGVELGVTHTEVRLTASGPRLVELNGRLGGDLIPLVGALSNGVDLVRAAAELALGRQPDLRPGPSQAAEVRFVYPDRDCVVRGVDVTLASQVPGVVRAVALAGPGTQLLLPPRQAIPRLAALVAVAADEQTCKSILDTAEAAVEIQVEPV